MSTDRQQQSADLAAIRVALDQLRAYRAAPIRGRPAACCDDGAALYAAEAAVRRLEARDAG